MIPTFQLLRLLAAIAVVESNNRDDVVGRNGERGRYQMTYEAWREVDLQRYPNETFAFRVSMNESHKAQWLALLYLRKHTDPYLIVSDGGTGRGKWVRSATLQDAARIWNGGPDGWKNPSTEVYWEKIETVYNQQSFMEKLDISKNDRLDRDDIITACPLQQNQSPAGQPASIHVTVDVSSSPSAPATQLRFDLSASAETVHFSIPSPCTIRLNVAKPATSQASR